jgi:tight adherence protein C
MLNALGLFIVSVALAGSYVLAKSWSVRQRALAMLYADAQAQAGIVEEERSRVENALEQWLARAGYRGANAPAMFAGITLGCVLAGIALSQIYRVVLFRPLADAVLAVPGSAGDMLTLVLQTGPWIILVIAGFIPAIVVRSQRRARMAAIEQDLPLALELFATMAEAGLGFDAALAKIIRAQGDGRALSTEFINFQHDMLAGIPRSQALRQLARRVDVPSLSSFTSALIQAEQVGASMAETLQHQAEDLRQRRRENALLQAQALPVKLVFPLVICFLPGIFISTLAPVLYQMVQVADSVLRSSGR